MEWRIPQSFDEIEIGVGRQNGNLVDGLLTDA
jgi:hypothetical protein